MAFWDFLKPKPITLSEKSNKVRVVNAEAQGSSGTDLISGILNEEYLDQLSGTQGMDIFDKMRRSDAKIKMCLSAVNNPIKGANWEVESASDDPKDELMADFVREAIFNNRNKSWRALLHEILSMTTYGYSLFERVHQVADGRRWGKEKIIKFKTFAYRSQRTIEYWNLDEESQLQSVSQYAYGDFQKVTVIPAKFLTLFSLDKEGDNFEGVSMLRPCYGPWLRKNTYLKLMAIGIEKFAVPTPILTVPDGLEGTDQFNQGVNVLKRYLTHEQNYITKPEGWELELSLNSFDPSRIQGSVDAENTEMVNAFMANFLQLGQSGSGSYALSFDLSDFFLGGIEHIAELVCEVFNDGPIKELIDLNWGPQENYPKLFCSGISDKAGKELADTLKVLADGNFIKPDDKLEKHIRNRYNLPESSVDGQASRQEDPQSPVIDLADKLADKKKSIELADTKRYQPHRDMKEFEKELLKLMRHHLGIIANNKSKKLVNSFKNLTPSTRRAAIKNTGTKGVADYLSDLKLALAIVAERSYKLIKSGAPKSLKLAEDPTEFFGFEDLSPSQKKKRLKQAFGDLPPKVRNKVVDMSSQLKDTQLNDLDKVLNFQYINSIDTISDPAVLEAELDKVVESIIAGPIVRVGAANAVSQMVNGTRDVFVFDPDISNEIESMTFRNPDPVTDICKNLVDRTFKLNDPGVQRYTPPLHHNCKSYLEPNFKGGKNPPISPVGLRPTGTEVQIERMEKQINLSDQID